MARLTPEGFADKQIRRLSAAGADMRAGVEAVSENPCELAADKADDWQAKMAQEKTKAKFQAGLRRVSLADWKKKMVDVGIPRVATGISAARPKIVRFATAFLPHAANVSAEVKAMPGVTLEDGIARATHTIRRMAEFKMPS